MPARDWIDYTVLGINVILAVTAGAGVLAAFRTLRVIRSQTKATEESVEETRRAVLATEKSVEAQMRTTRSFINVERPFIVVEAKGNVDHLSLVAINKGRTPARILFINPLLQWDYVPYKESLPPEPNYTGNSVPIKDIENFNLEWILSNGVYQYGSFRSKELIEADPDIAASIKRFDTTFYIYSTIRYTGHIDETDIYETRFCYKMTLNGEFILGGPYGYNKNT